MKSSKVNESKGNAFQPKKAPKGSKGRTSSKKNNAAVKDQPANLPTLKPITNTKPANFGTNILRILAITAVIGITVYIYSVRERVDDFAEYGYPGIFLIALMANATVLLPAPGVAVVFAMGSILNPIGVALAAGTGGAIGELSGYLAGFSGQAVVERTDVYNKISPWIEKYGGWTILVLSAIPNPFFDIAGIAAGIAKMKLWRFLLFCWVGQIIKMAMFAFAGAYSIDWIASFYK
ncbi:MAG TPA: VTT domain-containing protein [Anaerolineales bacterium]|nr:VTT domain-containing protein [Anaerolineales bacterium]